MRKPTTGIVCENKDGDQLCSNCTADRRLCFRHMDSTIPLLLIYELDFNLLALFCDYTAWFVSDGWKPNCWFSHAHAQYQASNQPPVRVTSNSAFGVFDHDRHKAVQKRTRSLKFRLYYLCSKKVLISCAVTASLPFLHR